VELEGAIHSLYGHYRLQFERWQADAPRTAAGGTPPVFVVVCNNTSVSKLVFDYVAGWSRMLADGKEVAVPGALPLFSNVEGDRWSSRPTSILVDSEQLESGDAMSDEFKRMAATEIEEFKAEYRARFPGRDAGDLTDEDLLREVMNTVGKKGKLGESSSLSLRALASSARLIVSQVSPRIALMVLCSTDFFGLKPNGSRAKARNEAESSRWKASSS
jgi:type III restriction enzyme